MRLIYRLSAPKIVTLILVSIILTNCTSSTSQPETPSTIEVVESETNRPEKTIENLLSWLESHSDQSDERKCFEMDGVDVTKMDSVCIQTHLNTLANTNLFSSFYIDQLRLEFEGMQMDIEKEGYAASADYDRYFNSQDPPSISTTLDILTKTKNTITTDQKATVKLTFAEPDYTLVYHLIKEDNVWKIKGIE